MKVRSLLSYGSPPTNHSVQDGNQYAPRFESRHVANQLVGKRHEVQSTHDPCGLVVLDRLAVLQAQTDKVSNERERWDPVPTIHQVYSDAQPAYLPVAQFVFDRIIISNESLKYVSPRRLTRYAIHTGEDITNTTKWQARGRPGKTKEEPNHGFFFEKKQENRFNLARLHALPHQCSLRKSLLAQFAWLRVAYLPGCPSVLLTFLYMDRIDSLIDWLRCS